MSFCKYAYCYILPFQTRGRSGTTNKQWKDFEDLQLTQAQKITINHRFNFLPAEVPFILTQEFKKGITKQIHTKKILPREEGPNQNNPKIPLPKWKITINLPILKGIVHFEIKIWYLSAYPKGIQDVGVFFFFSRSNFDVFRSNRSSLSVI